MRYVVPLVLLFFFSLPVAAQTPASFQDVAFARGSAELVAGARLEPAHVLDLAPGHCVRLVSGDGAALLIQGPARARVGGPGTETPLAVESGQGVFIANARGASIRLGDRVLEVWGGAVAFEVGSTVRGVPISGRARLAGALLGPAVPGDEDLLGLVDGCVPPRAELLVPLGDPASVVADASRRRAEGDQSGGDADTAEGGATCVDSPDSASATDPSQGSEGGVDPDARREAGRLRVILSVPVRRSR